MRGLICAKPIVTVQYFESWVEALDCDPASPSPDLGQFIPPVDSSLVQIDKELFLPNPERKMIFSGKTFIFPTAEQFDAMSVPVSIAGGTTTSNYSCLPDAILIEHSSKTPPDDYKRILNSLTVEGKRVVPMKEIGWAILTCSTRRYCNTSLNLEQTLFGKVGQSKTGPVQLTVLAPETQDIGLAPTRRRQEQEEEEELRGQPPAKKVKVEAIQIEVAQEIAYSEPPTKKICLHPNLQVVMSLLVTFKPFVMI